MLLFAALLATVPLAAAGLPGTPLAAIPGSWVSDYATEATAVPVGGDLSFFNGDLMRHNVVARGHFGAVDRAWCASFVAGRCPLFWSDWALLGETVPVEGLDQLVAGQTYKFYCTIHPSMEGTLVALPAPPP